MTHRLYVSTADRYAPLDELHPLQAVGSLPAPGSCADGSGNWLPLPAKDKSGFMMICPSNPLWPIAVAYNKKRLQQLKRKKKSMRGLGDNNTWPAGRSYHEVSQFRAPYRVGYFQDGSLMGLAGPSGNVENAIDQNASPNVKRYLIAGEPVPTLGRDISLPFNQVSRAVYAVIGVVALGISYASYKQFKKRNKTQSGGQQP